MSAMTSVCVCVRESVGMRHVCERVIAGCECEQRCNKYLRCNDTCGRRENDREAKGASMNQFLN